MCRIPRVSKPRVFKRADLMNEREDKRKQTDRTRETPMCTHAELGACGSIRLYAGGPLWSNSGLPPPPRNGRSTKTDARRQVSSGRPARTETGSLATDALRGHDPAEFYVACTVYVSQQVSLMWTEPACHECSGYMWELLEKAITCGSRARPFASRRLSFLSLD